MHAHEPITYVLILIESCVTSGDVAISFAIKVMLDIIWLLEDHFKGLMIRLNCSVKPINVKVEFDACKYNG